MDSINENVQNKPADFKARKTLTACKNAKQTQLVNANLHLGFRKQSEANYGKLENIEKVTKK